MPHARLHLLKDEIENHISSRTGRRVRDLAVELSPERVVLRGETLSYYVKQLAQHGALEILPDVSLENSIVVRKQPDAIEQLVLN
jgi:hypothetical protein